MPSRPASYVYETLPYKELRERLKNDFIRQRENALKEKSGENSYCFRDSSIRIFILDDVNMEKILSHHESGKVGKIHLYGAWQVLNHPNYPESEV